MPRTVEPRTRLFQLFGRAAVMRRALITVMLVTTLLTAIPAISAALTLSPEQAAARELGEFDASVQLPWQVATGTTAPRTTEFDHALSGAGAYDTADVLTAPDVPLGELRTAVMLKEAHGVGVSVRYVLTGGEWPTRPGDVVIVNPSQEFSSLPPGTRVPVFNGRQSVNLVGFASDPFARGDPALLAAPGTWEALDPGLRVTYPNVTGTVTRFWKTREPISKEALIQAWTSADPHADASEATDLAVTYTTRPELLAVTPDPLLSRFPLTLIVPLFALPLATALLIGVALRRWLDRTGRTLFQVGVQPALVARAGRQAATLAVAIGLAFGAVTGTLIAGLARPALQYMSTQPLSPLMVPWSALGLVSLGLAAGLIGTLFTRLPRWRFVNSRWLLQLSLVSAVGVVALAVATGVTAVSLSVATGAVVIGAALCSPNLVRVGVRLPSRSRAVTRLPRLFIDAERTRAALAVGGLIVALALPICALTVVLTAESAEQRASLDTLPAGFVLLQSLNEERIPTAVRQQFESYTGLSDPVAAVMVVDDERSPHFPGAIWEFASTNSVERWLGRSLDARQVATLSRGLLITTDSAAGQVVLREGKTTATMPSAAVEVAPEWPQNVGGVVIDGTFPSRFTRAPATLIYVNVNPEQLARARSAASTLGFSRDYIRYPHATDAVSLPTRYFVAIAAMGLAPALIMGAWASAQARQLRPALAGLHALGLSRRVLASVVVRQAGLLVGLAGLATTLCVLLVATVTSLGSEDRLVVVPWQGIVITAASGLASVAVATAAGLRRLTAVERLNT